MANVTIYLKDNQVVMAHSDASMLPAPELLQGVTTRTFDMDANSPLYVSVLTSPWRFTVVDDGGGAWHLEQMEQKPFVPRENR